MKVTIEMIDELRSRVNVTYEEAKDALEKNDGDLVKSIIQLEKRRKTAYKAKAEKVNKQYAKTANKFLSVRFIVKGQKGQTVINIPLVLGLIMLFFAPYITIPGIIIALLAKCSFSIGTMKNNKTDIQKTVNDVAEKIKKTASKIIETPVEVEEASEENDDDENEITIE